MGIIVMSIFFFGLGGFLILCKFIDFTDSWLPPFCGLMFIMTAIFVILIDRGILYGRLGTAIGLFGYIYPIASIMFVIGLMQIIVAFKANIKTEGLLISKTNYGGGLTRQTNLTFKYRVNGKGYQREAKQSVGRFRAAKLVEGQTYKIYVSEDDPSDIVFTKFSFSSFNMVFWSVMLYLIPILYLTGSFAS